LVAVNALPKWQQNLEDLKTSGAIVLTILGDHGAIRDGAHGCCGYWKGSRE
jgi:hypothetical protein